MEGEGSFSITIHHARDIQNICIYGNQDVYAKFAVMSPRGSRVGPAFATRPIRGGGRNPVFNQTFHIPAPLAEPRSALRCEIWMLSRARSYLQDQLLGFALVPLAGIRKEMITREYVLTSTELFHSPAGAVRLSLVLQQESPGVLASSVLLDPAAEDRGFAPTDYGSIEFPDLHAASEQQHMIAAYFNTAAGDRSLDLVPCGEAAAAAGMKQEPPFSDVCMEGLGLRGADTWLGSVPCAAAGVKTSLDKGGKDEAGDPMPLPAPGRHPYTNVVSCDTSVDAAVPGSSHRVKDGNEQAGSNIAAERDGVAMPSMSVPLATPEPIVRQQIVDMYVESVQHFAESLAKMRLPLDAGPHRQAEAVDAEVEDADATCSGKKKGSKVFYGSGAFF